MVAKPLSERSGRVITPVLPPQRQVESMLRMSLGSLEEQYGPDCPLEGQASLSRAQQHTMMRACQRGVVWLGLVVILPIKISRTVVRMLLHSFQRMKGA